jgi:heavy metal translocating P-type ATPase
MSKIEQLPKETPLEDTESKLGARNTRIDIIRLCLTMAAAAISFTAVGKPFVPVDVLAVAAVFLGGYPIYKETFESLRHARVNMEVSMAIAIFASLAVGQYAVSALITSFVLLSEYIENYAIDKGRATIDLLEKSVPKKALVKRNGLEVEIDTQSLAKNDIVVVRDGDRIPVDGIIVIGSAYVNQSAITGESARIEKTPGDLVYAGSVSESGIIEVRTEKVGRETLFGKIIELVEEAENRKAPIQRISDKLATYLVEFAIGFSLVTYILTRNLTSTISVIVVAGACGVAAGTPLAIVAIMGKAAKKGAIIKGGAYVEEMSKIDTVVIDKTGTLTLGQPVVESVISIGSHSERDVLEYAAIAERHSTHPLARAILNKAAGVGIEDEKKSTNATSTYFAGKGIESADGMGKQVLVGNAAFMVERNVKISQNNGENELNLLSSSALKAKSRVLVAIDGEICGQIFFSDKVRTESKRAISDLKRMGIRTIMLTGDKREVATAVAKEVGIDEVHSELLPQDKVSFVESLVSAGHRVAMVGDGINDAPALARANVGIGMGGGTDVAIEEADIVLMNNDLERIAEVAKLSKKAYRTIMTNFYGTVSVDGVGVALAAMGLLNPLLAAVIHVTSELIFILNSARLIR